MRQMILPDWFEEIRYIMELRDLERDWMAKERDPHPTTFIYTLSNKGHKTIADIF